MTVTQPHDLRQTAARLRAPSFCLVFLAALAWRAGYAVDVARHPDHGWSRMQNTVVGQPTFDALFWDRAAEALSAGQPFESYTAGRRPLWPTFLALFYQATGPRVVVAYAINVAAGALLIALVYHWLRRQAGARVALGVAALQLIWPCQLALGYSAMSEPVGSLWLAIALLLAAEAGCTNRIGTAIAAGAMHSIGNMTRTVGFFDLPLVALWMWLSARGRGASRGAAARLPAWYLAAAAMTLVPFAVRHYQRTGAAGISDVSNLLYCATSPQYGSYSGQAEHDPARHGFHTPRGRYEFYMREVHRNLREHPGLYARRVLNTLHVVALDLAHDARLCNLIGAALAFLAALAWRRWWRDRSVEHLARAALATALLGAWLMAVVDVPWLEDGGKQNLAARWWPLVVTGCWGWGAWRAVRLGRSSPLVLLAVLVLAGMLGIALIVNFDTRFTIPLAWAFQALVLVGLEDLARRLLAIGALPLPPTAALERVVGLRPLVAIALGFVAIASGALLLQQRSAQPPNVVQLTPAAAEATLDVLAQARPQWLGDWTPSPGWLAGRIAVASPRADDSETSLVLLAGQVDRHRYYFPAGIDVPLLPTQPFLERDYDRTIVYVDGYDAWGQRWVALPLVTTGDTRRDWQGPQALVARLRRWRDSTGDVTFAEALTAIPLDEVTGLPRADAARLFDPPRHLQVLALASGQLETFASDSSESEKH